MADEVNASFLLPGPPATHVAACPGVEFHRYEAPAGHAFSNWDAPSMYHEPAAESAWDRSLAFLDTHLR